MLLSMMVRSMVTSSRNGISGGAPVAEPGSGRALASPERTRRASRSSGVLRWRARQLQDDVHVLLLARHVEQIHGLAADGSGASAKSSQR